MKGNKLKRKKKGKSIPLLVTRGGNLSHPRETNGVTGGRKLARIDQLVPSVKLWGGMFIHVDDTRKRKHCYYYHATGYLRSNFKAPPVRDNVGTCLAHMLRRLR